MKVHSESFIVPTNGKGTYLLTPAVQEVIRRSGVREGQVTVFVQHTSASLVVYENADPTAREDLHHFMERLVPESDAGWVHVAEGPDDTTSHLRMALTRTSETIPLLNGRLALGIWQGLYLFEHRRAPHERRIAVSVLGQ